MPAEDTFVNHDVTVSSSISSRRLRDVEVRRPGTEGGVVPQDRRVRLGGGEIRSKFAPQPGDVVHAALGVNIPNYASAS